jgi:hypothetical protein
MMTRNLFAIGLATIVFVTGILRR